MSVLPFWKQLDPLPVLGGEDDKKGKGKTANASDAKKTADGKDAADEQDDGKVEEMFDKD